MVECLVVCDDTRNAQGWKSGGWAQVGWLAGAVVRLGIDTIMARSTADGLLQFKDAWKSSRKTSQDLTPVAQRMEKLQEMQIWSHGGQARPMIGDTALSSSMFGCFRAKFAKDRGVIWFRCCEVAKGESGREFLKAVAESSGARFVAGHEGVIGPAQNELIVFDAQTGQYHGPYGGWANPNGHLSDHCEVVRKAQQ